MGPEQSSWYGDQSKGSISEKSWFCSAWKQGNQLTFGLCLEFGNLNFFFYFTDGRAMMWDTSYEGWNFNFGNTPLDWIQELLE